MVKLQALQPWLDKHLLFNKDFLTSFRWLYAPSRSSLLFSLRTTLATFVALAIALWMEMDSPKWAPMTVWIVARNTSRGETISKAYWRIVGTIGGAVTAVLIVAAFPQQPMLFDLTVALFVGGCCWFAVCMRNFQAYAMVLAGYTCAIIAFSSVEHPEGIFMLAIARATYIILGVLADDFVGRFFDFNLTTKAHEELNKNLLTAIEGTVKAISDMLAGDELAASRSNELFTAITTYNNNVEFREAEMRGYDYHSGDHAHAAFYSVTAVLARTMGMSIHMRCFKDENLTFNSILPEARDCLEKIIKQLNRGGDYREQRKLLEALRWECRQRITNSFFEQNDSPEFHDEVYNQKILNDRILYRSLSELLGELQITLMEYDKSCHPKVGDNFRFSVKTRPNYSLAWKHALRTFVATMGACLMWQVTGWDQGGGCVSLLCMGCARFCLFENPSLVCWGWFKGSIWAVLIGGIMVFCFMAVPDTIEMLWFVLFIPTMLCGLGIADVKTLPVAASYAPYFFYMVGVNNQSRVDEITFLNNIYTLMGGIFFSIAAFTLIYPYNPINMRRQLRQTLLENMQQLARAVQRPNPREWLSHTSDAFVTMMRQMNTTKNTHVVQAYSHGTIAVMMIGLNVIRLRIMIDHDIVTDNIKVLLKVVLRRISLFSGRYGRTVAVAHNVISRLRKQEQVEENLSVRMEISAAVSCLTLISDALDRNVAFLDMAHPFLLSEKWNE